MAIERNNFGGSTQPSEPDNLNRLKLILVALSDLLEVPIRFDDKRIQDECNRVVRELVNISVPTLANQIKEFQNYLNSVGLALERIIRQSSNPEQIFISCLQTLYCQLVSNGKSLFLSLHLIFLTFHSTITNFACVCVCVI